MMVLRRKSGWEYLCDDPVRFFSEVLQLQLEPHHKAMLAAIGDGRRSKLGMVFHKNKEHTADEATIAVGLAFWAAACRHRPTLIWGGRRTTASAWMDHAVMVLQAARAEFRFDFKLIRPSDWENPWGILMPNGSWALRYDGPLPADQIQATRNLGCRANILIGDFKWVDRESMSDAVRYTEVHDALLTVVIGTEDGSRS